jgi:hypothetical protein
MKGRILHHLAAALAGWGIVELQHPAPSDAEQSIAFGKSSIRQARDREAFDREAGDTLLRRLVPDLAPAPAVEVVRHEGSLEERLVEAGFDDPLADNPSTPSDESITDYLCEQIQGTLSGEAGPDLSYAFLHGRLEARQVLDSLRRTFPDLAGEEQFTRAVVKKLFLIEPARAALLARELPPRDHWSWISEFKLDAEGFMSPAGYLSLLDLQLVHAPAAEAFLILGYPADSAALHYRAYGDEYIPWLLDQPPSPGRRLMLESCVAHLRDADPSAAAALEKRLSTR